MKKKLIHSKISKALLLIVLLLSFIPSLFGQYVSNISPHTATINEYVIFTVSGSNLTDNMLFYVNDLVSPTEISGGTSTLRHFQGTFNEWAGDKNGLIKDQYGNVIYTFIVTVSETPAPTFSSVTPNSVILGETVTFTINGTNLNNELVYYLPDFGSEKVNSSSSTTQKTFTTTSSINTGIKHCVIKDDFGGDVLYNFDVDVYFPIPNNFIATAVGSTQINLNWNSVANTFEYRLYRATSEYGSYDLIYNGESTSYPNVSLNSSTSYYYRIQACQNINEYSRSPQSNYISATTGGGGVNHVPDNPSFRPLPSGYQYQVNIASSIPISSSTDQDGDETQVRMWSANSTNPQNTPYNSPFSLGIQNYNPPITFTQSGIQTVYLQSFDSNGAESQVVTRNYDVLPEDTENNPDEPDFVSCPAQAEFNQSINVNVKSGEDPNGDLVQIKLWATNSNHTSGNPYESTFNSSLYEYAISLNFNQVGDQIIYCQTVDDNGNSSTVINRTISITDGTTTLTEVEIGNITFTAISIIQTSNIYTLTGNVLANDIIHFTGTVILDLDDLNVTGNGRVYLSDIPNFNSDVNLYDGLFAYNVPNNSSELRAVGMNEANELLSMANLPVHIESINLLSDGINITGDVQLPELFGFVKGGINQLQITKSQGLDLAGSISFPEIQATGFKLKNIALSFNTIDDEFSGEGSIETLLFEAGANIKIISTGVDEIGMFLSLSNPVPLGVTGLALSNLQGGIINIQSHPNPPMIINIGANLTPLGAPSGIIEFTDVTLSYEFGTSLTGSGTFKVLGTETASAGFEVREGLFKINAQINFYDIINSAIEAGIAKNENGDVDVFASFSASMQIPGGDGFPYSWLEPFIDLPHTFANFENVLYNTELSGKGLIDVFIFDTKFSYLLTYTDGTLHKEFAKNYSLFNENVFKSNEKNQLKYLTPSKSLSNWNSPDYNRFEGQSLIIEPSEYKNSRNKENQIIQDFVLPGEVETLVLRVIPEDGITPDVLITMPSGTIITSVNVDYYEDVIYSVNSDNNSVYYTFNNAPAGAWVLTLNDNGKTNFADIFGTDNEAGIIINNIQHTGNTVDVSWVDDNPDFDGQISLYYDYNNTGIDGSLIVSGISEDDNTDSYSFDVSDFETGVYYVYAIMFDENGVPVTSYSNEPFIIHSDIAAPINFSHIINNDGGIEFSWNIVNDGNSYDYLLYYQKDHPVSFGSQNINVGTDINNFTFTNIDAGYIYQFMVVAQNSTGGLGEASSSIEIDLAKYQSLSLNEGWNLIGFSLEPFNLSVEEVFASINDKLIQVKDETLSYDPNLPYHLNTLREIENGKGYWVKLNQETQLTGRGKDIDFLNLEIQLNEGWNLISYPSQYPKEVQQALNNISDKIILVKDETLSYDPNLPYHLNTLRELIPGEGYWIKVNQNCILTF